MNTCIIFFVAIYVAPIVVALAITEEHQLEEIGGYIKQCQAKLGLTDDFLDRIGSSHESDVKKLGEFALCFTTSIGVQTPTGNIVYSRIKELFQIKEETAQEILTKCKRRPSSSAEESAISFLQCLDNFPRL